MVKLESFPAFDPEAITEQELADDHLQEVAELLDEMELMGDTELEDCSGKTFRYDLCPTCHAKFTKDPLGRDTLRRLNFSEN